MRALAREQRIAMRGRFARICGFLRSLELAVASAATAMRQSRCGPGATLRLLASALPCSPPADRSLENR